MREVNFRKQLVVSFSGVFLVLCKDQLTFKMPRKSWLKAIKWKFLWRIFNIIMFYSTHLFIYLYSFLVFLHGG